MVKIELKTEGEEIERKNLFGLDPLFFPKGKPAGN